MASELDLKESRPENEEKDAIIEISAPTKTTQSRREKAAAKKINSITSGVATFTFHTNTSIVIDPPKKTIILPVPKEKWEMLTSVKWRNFEQAVVYSLRTYDNAGQAHLKRFKMKQDDSDPSWDLAMYNSNSDFKSYDETEMKGPNAGMIDSKKVIQSEVIHSYKCFQDKADQIKFGMAVLVILYKKDNSIIGKRTYTSKTPAPPKINLLPDSVMDKVKKSVKFEAGDVGAGFTSYRLKKKEDDVSSSLGGWLLESETPIQCIMRKYKEEVNDKIPSMLESIVFKEQKFLFSVFYSHVIINDVEKKELEDSIGPTYEWVKHEY